MSGVLALVLIAKSGGLAVEEGLSVGGELQLGDDNVRGVDGDTDGGAVGPVLGQLLNVEAPLLTVDLGDLALGIFGAAANDSDLVVASNGHRLDAILLTEFARQVGAQELVTEVGGGRKVSHSAFSSRCGDSGVSLHSLDL